MSQFDLSIIIPAKNESQRLPQAMDVIIPYVGSINLKTEVVIVVNGSTDDTLRIAGDYARLWQYIRVMQSDPGKGAAVKAGMLQARGNWRYMCDVDLSTPIDYIPHFLDAAQNAEIVIGSREAEGAERINEPDDRHSMGRAFNSIVQAMLLMGINDSQCGFKLFRWDVALDLFHHQTLNGFAFDVEILYLARRRRYRVYELPVLWEFDPDSRVNPGSDALKMFFDLWKIRRNAARGVYGDLTKTTVKEALT